MRIFGFTAAKQVMLDFKGHMDALESGLQLRALANREHPRLQR